MVTNEAELNTNSGKERSLLTRVGNKLGITDRRFGVVGPGSYDCRTNSETPRNTPRRLARATGTLASEMTSIPVSMQLYIFNVDTTRTMHGLLLHTSLLTVLHS